MVFDGAHTPSRSLSPLECTPPMGQANWTSGGAGGPDGRTTYAYSYPRSTQGTRLRFPWMRNAQQRIAEVWTSVKTPVVILVGSLMFPGHGCFQIPEDDEREGKCEHEDSYEHYNQPVRHAWIYSLVNSNRQPDRALVTVWAAICSLVT